ncbi:MAG: hypothetical protein KGL39_49040 [Patescibacteria group bacterium]|nr:hypothetical protein [Patescibacteria group bacterium]
MKNKTTTGERNLEILRHWNSGDLTARDVVRLMADRFPTLTRNAVLAIVNRAGKAGERVHKPVRPGPSAKKPRVKKPKQENAESLKVAPYVALPSQSQASRDYLDRVALLGDSPGRLGRATELVQSVNGCRFGIGDTKSKDFHFCGAKRVPGTSWCAVHRSVVYVKGMGQALAAAASLRRVRW